MSTAERRPSAYALLVSLTLLLGLSATLAPTPAGAAALSTTPSLTTTATSAATPVAATDLDPFCGFTDIAPFTPFETLTAYCWAKESRTALPAFATAFGANNALSRNSFVFSLWRAASSPQATVPCGLSDISTLTQDAQRAACWALSQGIVSGTTLSPTTNLTRSWAAASLWRRAGSPQVSTSCGFADEALIPQAERAAACWARAQLGLAGGTWLPTANLSRGLAATWMWITSNKPALVTMSLDPFCGYLDLPVPAPQELLTAACWSKEIRSALPATLTGSSFGANNALSRNSFVFSLWRAASSPQATVPCGLSDISTLTQDAQRAACWALSQGIVSGTTLSPTTNLTRSWAAASLWRRAGSPQVSTSCGFADEALIPQAERAAACWVKARLVLPSGTWGAMTNLSRSQAAWWMWVTSNKPSLKNQPPVDAMVLWVDTTLSAGTTVTLPLHAFGQTSFTLDWGDGTSQQVNGFATGPTHTYAAAGYYRIVVRGAVTTFGGEILPRNVNAMAKLVAVSSVGTMGLTDMSYAFSDAVNLVRVPSYLPPSVSTLRGAFSHLSSDPRTSARKLNFPLTSWRTTNVTDMSSTFDGASSFNQPLGSWDTSNVTTMARMFRDAQAFNQPIGMWNTAKVTNLSGMFKGASRFNQPIGTWNTASVTNLREVFQGASAFNQPLNTWNTAKVQNLTAAFQGASSFNQTLAGWNTSSVTSLQETFKQAAAFNQPIGSWNTSKVTDMAWAFQGASSFNQPLAGWNTAAVTDMTGMFNRATVFNQNLSSWPVSSVGAWNVLRVSSALQSANLPARLRTNTQDATLPTTVAGNSSFTDTQQGRSWHFGAQCSLVSAALGQPSDVCVDAGTYLFDYDTNHPAGLSTNPDGSIDLVIYYREL